MARDAAAMPVDVLVRDDKGGTVLVVEIERPKAVDDRGVREQLRLHASQLGASFGMLVDDERILVAPRAEEDIAWERGVTLSTSEIVAHYYPDRNPATIEGFFLESLIQAWLRDFSFGWHCTSPPGLADLTKIGVAQLLHGSEVATEDVA